MKEQFRDINGYNGKYKVSNLGRVIKDNHGEISISKNKYLGVSLYLDGERKYYSIHKLVAEHFIDNPDNKKYINHIDGNKLNNCVENLEWCTASENERHSYNILGKIVWNKGKKISKEHINNLQYARKNTFKNRYKKIIEDFYKSGLSKTEYSLYLGKNRNYINYIFKRYQVSR